MLIDLDFKEHVKDTTRGEKILDLSFGSTYGYVKSPAKDKIINIIFSNFNFQDMKNQENLRRKRFLDSIFEILVPWNFWKDVGTLTTNKPRLFLAVIS